MNDHPVQLVLEDDLERRRITVVVRWLLAIPLYVWAALWGIAALLAAALNWLATLVRGRSPQVLHDFLAKYVKYVMHVYAYASLVAQPYPSFDGRDGYPVDLRIAGPAPQRRWRVALRALLALPAFALWAVLVGAPDFGSSGRVTTTTARSGLIMRHTATSGGPLPTAAILVLVAVLGWFACMARGRMPRGLRDLAAYCLLYGAQFWSYAFLLTERYPNSDPYAALPGVPVRRDPLAVRDTGDARRSRLTVFFRFPLAFPHLLWLTLWGVLAAIAAAANWLSVLVLGRSPAPLHGFLSAFARYQLHVGAFLCLIAGPFPGFTGAPDSYPVEASIEPPARQRRWSALLRLVLALPAMILQAGLAALLLLAAVLGWFASLATGRMPAGLRAAGAHVLRYQLHTYGYLLLLCDSYPYSGPCRDERDGQRGFTSPAQSAFG